MLIALLRVLAIILLVFFVIALPTSLLLRDVGALAFDPETTKTLVREHLLNSELIASLARQATEQMLSGQLEGASNEEGALGANVLQDALAQLSDEDWRQITELAVPENLVAQSVDGVVDSYAEWLDSDADFPDLQLDLRPWKENTRTHAPQVVEIVLQALPECTLGEAVAMSMEGLQAEGLTGVIPSCRPPEPLYSALLTNAHLLLEGPLLMAPDRIDLNDVTQGNEAPEELVRLKEGVTRVRSVANWTWLGVVALGVLAVAMAARNIKQILLWSGWPLLLAGGIVLILALGLQFFSLRFLDEMLADAFSGGAGAEAALGSAVAAGALDLVSRPLLLQGLLATALGTAALLYARSLTKREQSPGIPINKKKISL